MRGSRRGAAGVVASGVLALTCAAAPAAEDDWARTYFLEGGAMPACGICHSLDAAEATGTVGPDLDLLEPTEQQVYLALRDGVGVMPAFSEELPEDRLRALADYVARAVQE
ncbi:c-type cytochrome [Tranquillimonas alkanivorans]|uniref:c-type cytochrome n=1 Tax=Tranquillimonas alkanivorans TaxID=441119 RepID=UPI0015A6C942|nr:cytochrome c [Tranquillimonas alkanivorans]